MTTDMKAAIERVRYVRDSHFTPDADLTTGDLATVIQLAEIGRLAVEARKSHAVAMNGGSNLYKEAFLKADARDAAADAFLAGMGT